MSRRQAVVAGGRVKLCEVWVSEEQRAELLARAGAAGITVPRLLVETTLATPDPPPAR